MEEIVRQIISEAVRLKNKYAKGVFMALDYVCIFCQTNEELKSFTEEAEKIGKVVKETPTGKLYVLDEKYPDDKGTKILKVRIPDETREERGDCDFKIDDYQKHREQLLSLSVAKLILREDSEMIELWDQDYNARVYFSNPPVSQDLNVKY